MTIPKRQMSKLARIGVGLLMIIEGLTLILTLGWWRPDILLPYIKWDVRRRFLKETK